MSMQLFYCSAASSAALVRCYSARQRAVGHPTRPTSVCAPAGDRHILDILA
jgi:hypothetical protein